MEDVPQNFGIEVHQFGTNYKSIKSISWENIPDFAIITGKNGSGKTQLLEILHYHFTKTRPPPHTDLSVNVTSHGATLDADEVGFVPSTGRFGGGSSASAVQLQGNRQSLYQQLQNKHSYIHDPFQMGRIRRVEKRLAGRDWQAVTKNGQISLDDNEFDDLLFDVDAVSHLATIFVDYRLKQAEMLLRRETGEPDDGRVLGPAPWEVVNEALSAAGFPYEVITPSGRLTDIYILLLKDRSSGTLIGPSDLSSGEQVILQLTLWLFSSSKEGVFPKLLLLDEPDAHLHPSMTVQFLDVISEVLVRKHGVKVIMTTHSPSTVALAPEGSVFQMERGETQIRRVEDRASIISILTAGLITVSPATRFCFVEDDDDVNFYNAVLDILTDMGPSRDPCAIRTSPSLVFIPASVGRGSEKVSGGKTIVEKWVAKLDAPPLTTTFLGVLDRDVGNIPTSRIKVIGRYSFENYLLDPINLFGLLLENGTAPAVNGVVVSSGDEHHLRGLKEDELQAISDLITSRTEAENPKLDTTTHTEIAYTNGLKIQVPQWVVDHRGHDLLPMHQKAWGGPQTINPPRLVKALRRVRLVPRELAALYAELQGSSS